MTPSAKRTLESRSLLFAMWGSLFMAVTGVISAFLSNSTAILTDGLFSFVGFVAAYMGRRISRREMTGPDRYRPWGYAADEALFATFRALSLLGLVIFAVMAAGMNIYDYLSGAPTRDLRFEPMFVYFAIVGFTCLGLCTLHFYAWSRTGKTSEILRLEAKAALFDAIITAAAGVGLWAVYTFRDGFLAPVAPIGDSLIVLILCFTVMGQYRRDMIAGMSELAGVTAAPKTVAMARRAIRPCVVERGGKITDLSVTKLGRDHLVSVYYDPLEPILAAEIDSMNLRMIRDVRAVLPGADVLLMVSECSRQWPDDLRPS